MESTTCRSTWQILDLMLSKSGTSVLSLSGSNKELMKETTKVSENSIYLNQNKPTLSNLMHLLETLL
jgi:hypothetical protein